MRRYSIEPRTRKYIDFYDLPENIKQNYWKRDKILPKKQVIKKQMNFLGNKTADVVAKPNDDNNDKKVPAEEIIISTEKKYGSIKQIEKSITKMDHYKIFKLVKDSSVSKFVTRK